MNIEKIKNILKEQAATVTGQLGVYFLDLKTGASCAHNPDVIFPTASTFKVFLLAELFRQANEGKFSLSDRYILQEEDKAYGSGMLRLFDTGAALTLRDLAMLMMKISDNTATDILFRLVTRDSVKENTLDPLGFTQTKCDLDCAHLLAVCYQREVGAPPAKVRPNLRNAAAYIGNLAENDETSPRNIADMLQLIYAGKWVDADTCKQMLSIMKLCDGDNRITKYLPAGTVVAHKTGSMDRVANDVGIVYTPKGDYILAMFYNGNTAAQEEYDSNKDRHISDEVLARISGEIYAEYTQIE